VCKEQHFLNSTTNKFDSRNSQSDYIFLLKLFSINYLLQLNRVQNIELMRNLRMQDAEACENKYISI
jgi:hypothetical protein